MSRLNIYSEMRWFMRSLFTGVLLSYALFAQDQTKAPCLERSTADRAYTRERLVAMVSDQGPARADYLIRTCGVAEPLTGDLEEELIKAGAGPKVILAVRESGPKMKVEQAPQPTAAPAVAKNETGDNLSETRIQEIIQKFAEKETEFSKVRQSYTYRQTSKLQEFKEDGTPGGKWEMVSDIVFVGGKRTDRVVRSPVATLQLIQMDPGDEQDLRTTQPFVLTTVDLPNYQINYLGRETIDEIGCYVFAVKPKKMEATKRYFLGQIWVDDRDLQIVKSFGRGTGVQKRGSDFQYPKFETYREQIDGKYWFPTYTIASDVLQFKENSVRIRETVRYEDYKQFKAESTIKYEEEPVTPPPAKPVSPPKK